MSIKNGTSLLFDDIEKMGIQESIEILEHYHDKYNNPSFIDDDPISIPHTFNKPEDIEISGFLVATIAWGNRKAIIKSAKNMMTLMDNCPAEFIRYASDNELEQLRSFVYRTFNGNDLFDLCLAIRNLILHHGSLHAFFATEYKRNNDIRLVLATFRNELLQTPHMRHMEKHISSIEKGAACKRLCMYLRWMVRHDRRGVDFGIWKEIPMSGLYIPLDVHSSTTARELNLLSRKQNDWKAVEELTANLRAIDSNDPIRFDFSLFGAGAMG